MALDTSSAGSGALASGLDAISDFAASCLAESPDKSPLIPPCSFPSRYACSPKREVMNFLKEALYQRFYLLERNHERWINGSFHNKRLGNKAVVSHLDVVFRSCGLEVLRADFNPSLA